MRVVVMIHQSRAVGPGGKDGAGKIRRLGLGLVDGGSLTCSGKLDDRSGRGKEGKKKAGRQKRTEERRMESDHGRA